MNPPQIAFPRTGLSPPQFVTQDSFLLSTLAFLLFFRLPPRRWRYADGVAGCAKVVLPTITATLHSVSLTEIKSAVDALSPEELAELAAFIRERDDAAWDRQIDRDFAEGGRLLRVAEEVREDIRAGRL